LILLSLPPFGFSILYWIGLVIFLYTLITNTSYSYRSVFIFFLIINFVSLSWIIQSFYSGGLGYLILGIVLVCILSSFIAFLNFSFIKISFYFFEQSQLKYLLIPLSLSFVEILKEFILGGFPWNPAAIIYYKNLWVISLLPFIGVYGLGIIIHLLIGSCIYFLSIQKRFFAISIIIFATLIFSLSFFDKTKKINNTDNYLNILLIQPNIYESLIHYDVLKNFKKYEDLTFKALSQNPNADLIIWPEGSLPIDLNNRLGLLSRIGGLIKKDQLIILGSSAIENNELFNRLYVIDHKGKIIQHYDKQKLVLFGEFVPFIKPVISRFLNLGMNYISGEAQPLLNLPKNVQAVPMICFESIFNYSHINKNICKSDLVLQISNDSWFGNWYGPHQHLANSLLRSVEFKKNLIRSTPSGISAIIDNEGNILKSIPNNKSDFLYYEYPINYNLQNCFSKLKYTLVILIFIFGLSVLYVRIKK
tara:strand:+ start:4630 stop:6057 length:1428 start_codon:yes stop_codon:yes gene_type:complete